MCAPPPSDPSTAAAAPRVGRRCGCAPSRPHRPLRAHPLRRGSAASPPPLHRPPSLSGPYGRAGPRAAILYRGHEPVGGGWGGGRRRPRARPPLRAVSARRAMLRRAAREPVSARARPASWCCLVESIHGPATMPPVHHARGEAAQRSSCCWSSHRVHHTPLIASHTLTSFIMMTIIKAG